MSIILELKRKNKRGDLIATIQSHQAEVYGLKEGTFLEIQSHKTI